MVDVGRVRLVYLTTLEKHWEQLTADGILTELKQGLKTEVLTKLEKYTAMEKQQSKYALADWNTMDSVLITVRTIQKQRRVNTFKNMYSTRGKAILSD